MILEQLSNAVGLSGSEDAVRQIILDEVKGTLQDITVNSMGSVTGRLPAAGRGKPPLRVLLAAHMDEVGLMVTGFESDGLIRFTNVGGIDERILPGKRVKIGALQGVIIWTPIHKNNDQNAVKMSSLRIDIGAANKDEVAGKVKRGDRVNFDTQFRELDGGRMLRGKAFDDRAGCSLLVDVLRGGPYPVEVLAAFTVQEEIGLRGAQVVGQTLQPDVALILEGTTANDLPSLSPLADDETEINPTCCVGKGPTLTIQDASMIVNPKLLAFLKKTAAGEEIPYQFKSTAGGGTDGGTIHTSGRGVPTAVISLPCRYIHSPAALLLREDYDRALRLVQAALRKITPADYQQV
ncbi:MAG: M20/M25/M40 family metallo-hydrolase [Anaerolineae bacterium]|nr:M20/M25/M40 family metallo-hydrolase [Anaerolineae bacterium]